MASPYDILLEVRCKAEEVLKAGTSLLEVNHQATAAGAATTAAMEKGAAAAKGLQTQAGATASALTEAGNKGKEAGEKVASGAESAKRKLDDAAKSGHSLGETLRDALTFGAGNQLVERLVAIPHLLAEAVQHGIEFNSEMQKGGLAVAGSMKSVDKELTFEQAKLVGGEALDRLREKANKLGFDFHALVETFQINEPTLFHAGAVELQKQIDLMVRLNQLTQSKGLRGFQATRDQIDLLNGMGQRTILGKELEPLGINDQAIKQWKEAGTLVDELMRRLSAYGEAGAAASDTFGAAQQRFHNQFVQLEGEVTKPVFDVAKRGLDSLNKTLESGTARRELAGLSEQISVVLSVGAGLANFALQNAGALTLLADAVIALGAGFTTAKLVGAIGGTESALTSLLASLGPVGLTVAALTLALGAGVAIYGAFREQARQAEEEAKKLAQTEAEIALRIKHLTTFTGQQNLITELDKKIADFRAQREALARELAEVAEAERTGGNEGGGSGRVQALGHQVELLEKQIASLEKQLGDTRAVTSEERERNAANEAIRHQMEQENQLLADMLAKLPAFVEGLRNAVAELREAQKLEGMLGSQKVEFFGEKQASALRYSTEQAAQLLRKIGDETTPATIERPEDIARVLDAARRSGKELANDTNPLTSRLKAETRDLVQNLEAMVSKLVEIDKKLGSAKGEASSERKRASEAEYLDTQQTAINNARAAGQKQYADQLEREVDIYKKAKEISTSRNVDWKTAIGLATVYVDAANRAKDAADAEKNARKGVTLERKDEAAADRDRATAVERIRNALADLKANPFLTDAQKLPLELQLLREEEAQLRRNIEARKEYIAAHEGDPNFAPKVAQYAAENQRDERRIGQAETEAKQDTFGGGLETELVQLQNSFNVTGKTIGRTFADDVNVGFNALSQGITGAITETGNWRQVSIQAMNQIIGSLVNLSLKFVAHYGLLAAQMIAHKLLGSLLRNQDSTEKKTKAATDTTTQATPSLLESITTYGVAAAIGLAALLAAMAITGSFAGGGRVPGPRPANGQDNTFGVLAGGRGLVQLAGGEGIVNNPAMDYYGPGLLDAINNRTLPVSRWGYAGGGVVADSALSAGRMAWVGNGGASAAGLAAASPRPMNVWVVDSRQSALEQMRSRPGEDHIIQTVNNRKHELGWG